MDIPHLVTSILDNIRIHHTQNELSKLDISCPGIFKLEDFWAERSERNDACCEEPFADITYAKRQTFCTDLNSNFHLFIGITSK